MCVLCSNASDPIQGNDFIFNFFFAANIILHTTYHLFCFFLSLLKPFFFLLGGGWISSVTFLYERNAFRLHSLIGAFWYGSQSNSNNKKNANCRDNVVVLCVLVLRLFVCFVLNGSVTVKSWPIAGVYCCKCVGEKDFFGPFFNLFDDRDSWTSE